MKAPQKVGGRLTIGKGVAAADFNPNHDKKGLFARMMEYREKLKAERDPRDDEPRDDEPRDEEPGDRDDDSRPRRKRNR